MQSLPLLDLKTASQRLCYWFAPILSAEEMEHFAKDLQDFVAKDGAVIYQALEKYALDKCPDSWLFEFWQRKFLLERESLPLSSSNMTMKVDWQAPQTGLKRAAHFLLALLRLHFLYLRAPEKLKMYWQGQEDVWLYCQSQWQILRGALRRPCEVQDDIYIHEDGEDISPCILIFCQGYAWQIDVLDEKGALVNEAQLESVLYDLLHEKYDAQSIPFATPSVLPVGLAKEVYAQMMSRDENSRIMQSLRRAWFVASINLTHHRDEGEAFFQAAFGQGEDYWARKPLNYCCYVKDDRFFVHFDRSLIEPLAVGALLQLAQSLFAQAEYFSRRNLLPDDLNLQALNWRIDGRKEDEAFGTGTKSYEGTYALLYDALNDFRHRSERLMVSIYDVFINNEEKRLLNLYPFDALVQILLQYAQWMVYKEVRYSVQVIDMVNYYNERCDLIFTLTQDSLNCVQALAENRLNLKLFKKAIHAYEKRLNLSKNGGGVYGFWLAMREMAQKIDSPGFSFLDALMERIRSPFMASIASSKEQGVGKLVFAPAKEYGLSVSFAKEHNYCVFLTTHKRNKLNEIERFNRAIGSGLHQILLMLRDSEE